jgi:hypothetical protein
MRRSIRPFGFQQSTTAHECTVFADVDFEGDDAEEQVFYFIVDLMGYKKEVRESHGKCSYQWWWKT